MVSLCWVFRQRVEHRFGLFVPQLLGRQAFSVASFEEMLSKPIQVPATGGQMTFIDGFDDAAHGEV